MSRALAIFALAFLAAPHAWAISVHDVPDPRPRDHVVDLTGTLDSFDKEHVNAAASRASSFGELFVAVIPTTDGLEHRAYATALFNRLRLDNTPRNHGVIVMVAIQDRRAEIVFGDGMPKSITRTTDRIMQDVIVKNMKAGNATAAIVGAANAVADRILTNKAASPLTKAADFAADQPAVAYGSLGGIAGVGLVGGRLFWRYRRRRCQKCGDKMERLDEQADDKHLNEKERKEERLGSVDHDVWRCVSCGTVHKIAWRAVFTSYSRCGSCGTRALSKSSRTIVSATTYSSGTGETTERCAHCSYSNTYTYTIAQLSDSSSSSSSSSSGGGGSSSGSGSSGSW
jgi:uncharacterized protein